LWKATISHVMSVRLSIRMEQLGSHWTDFRNIWYLSIFRKSVDNIHVSLKSDKYNGYLHLYLCTFMIHSFIQYSVWRQVQSFRQNDAST